MAFFTSEYECKLDAKGRLVLPSKFKSNLPEASGNELMIKRGFEPCLVIYSMIEYKKIFSKIAGLNEFNEEYRNFQRNFFRGTIQAELDNMGRFLVPKPLIKYAQLEKEVIMVGLGNRIEVWNAKMYEDYLLKDPSELSALAQKYLNEE
jgi:MraZ protein